MLAAAHVSLTGLKDQDGAKRVSAERRKLVGAQIGPAKPTDIPSPGYRMPACKSSEARDALIDECVETVANQSNFVAIEGITLIDGISGRCLRNW
jgi:hypothetical protein